MKIWASLKKYISEIDRVWLLTWILIYIGFLTLDAFTHLKYGNASITSDFMIFGRIYSIPVILGGTFIGTTILKFTGIVLNFVYAHYRYPKDHLIQIALGFTLLADTLLILNNTSAIGVLVFCFAQYFHTSRFIGSSPTIFVPWTATLVGALFFGYFAHIESIFVVGFVYGISLIVNVIYAAKWYNLARKNKKTPEKEKNASLCALVGFILFLCCDLCVATSFFSLIGVFPAFLYGFANYFSWFFYYPSQIFVANSSALLRETKKKVAKTCTQ